MKKEKEIPEKTVEEQKEYFKGGVDAFKKEGLKLIEGGHVLRFDFCQTLEKIPNDSEYNQYKPSGNKMFLMGVCPKYFVNIVEKSFDILTYSFQK